VKKVSYKKPDELLLLTEKTRAETIIFIKKLKKKKPKALDRIVQDLHNEFFSNFSCLNCANCCKTIGPRLNEKDIDRIAKHLKMKPKAFIEQYVNKDEDHDYVFRDHPCPFLLHDNQCMIYDSRPKACREYPHTDRSRFVQIINLSHKNCETCPVVYEIFEQLRVDQQKLI
jgi:uncharacterized protein